MGYSIDPITADCYEGTTCLINKFGITDVKKLSRIESIITTAKCKELEQKPVTGDFGFDHYKAVHKYIFEDLYEWAGSVRTVPMSKKGTVFVDPDSIDSLADAIFTRLQKDNYYIGYDRADYIDSIVDFYIKTNILHPFREGNGRTQREFLAQLIRHSGHSIDFSAIDTEELMIATIQSANGVNDYLHEVFETAIK